jgi:hypothetical protein
MTAFRRALPGTGRQRRERRSGTARNRARAARRRLAERGWPPGWRCHAAAGSHGSGRMPPPHLGSARSSTARRCEAADAVILRNPHAASFSARPHRNTLTAQRLAGPCYRPGQIARTRRISVVAAVVPPTLLPTSHPDRSRQECRCEACESLGLPGAPGGVIIPPAVWRNRPVGPAPPSVQRDDPDLGVKTSIENDS